jgi:hypothetical protein
LQRGRGERDTMRLCESDAVGAFCMDGGFSGDCTPVDRADSIFDLDFPSKPPQSDDSNTDADCGERRGDVRNTPGERCAIRGFSTILIFKTYLLTACDSMFRSMSRFWEKFVDYACPNCRNVYYIRQAKKQRNGLVYGMAVNGGFQFWQRINDGVMGGASTSELFIEKDGSLWFFGTLRPINDVAFASCVSVTRELGVRVDTEFIGVSLLMPKESKMRDLRGIRLTVSDHEFSDVSTHICTFFDVF